MSGVTHASSGIAQLEFKPRRAWNGHGLSFWYCRCGAARKVTHYTIRGGERIERVHATPCKRCGTTDDPVRCDTDPWLYIDYE